MATNSKEVQAKADAKRAGKRSRHWTCIVYPESAPKNWREILQEQLVEAYISPLHDKDKTPTNEPKKEHYHVVICFYNPCSYNKVKEIFDLIGGVSNEYDSRVKELRQMARYLIHLDQPHKYQYCAENVIEIGGIRPYKELVMSSSDKDEVLDQIFDFIDINNICSFRDFCKICRTEKPEWKYLVYHENAYLIEKYIKSYYWELKNQTEIDTLKKIAQEKNQK